MSSAQQIAQSVFERIQSRFPGLRMERSHGGPVELAFDIPRQDGLNAEIHLSLQNEDELHLIINEHFWCEWFPCSETETAERYVNAVCGFIEGKLRVVEHYKGGRCFKAILEKNDGESWTSVAESHHPGLSWPTPSHTRVLQNLPGLPDRA